MAKVTFISHDGKVYPVDAHSGQSLMLAAVFNGVPGIVADCGGNASCGTCHVYIAPPWSERLPPRKPIPEKLILDGVPSMTPQSRLSCCIQITPDLDGLVAQMPETQYY
jgi:2Fe-2S ferredoxin